MEFKKAYKQEMEQIKHNPQMDMEIISNGEKMIRKKNKDKFMRIGVVAAMLALVIGINAGNIKTDADTMYLKFQLQIGKANMNIEDAKPIKINFRKQDETSDKGWYTYENDKDFLKKTGFDICKSDKLRFGSIGVGLYETSGNFSTNIYYGSQKASANGRFMMKGYKWKTLGFGDTHGKLLTKYKYGEDLYAYFITNDDYEKYKMQVVYFSTNNIMYQLFVDLDDEGTALAKNIIDCLAGNK